MGIEIREHQESDEYGYEGDKSCRYDANGWAWYTYFLPADGDHAFWQRDGVEARYTDRSSLAFEGARNGILYDGGQQAVFEAGDVFVKIEAPYIDDIGHAEAVAEAIAEALATAE